MNIPGGGMAYGNTEIGTLVLSGYCEVFFFFFVEGLVLLFVRGWDSTDLYHRKDRYNLLQYPTFFIKRVKKLLKIYNSTSHEMQESKVRKTTTTVYCTLYNDDNN